MARKQSKAKQTKNNGTKATPFRDAGKIVGKRAAEFFGIPGFKDIGSLVGSGIGRIFGSGDYTVTGPIPKRNVLMGQVPQFSTTKATNIVCHREYITDITGTTAFTNTTYPLNPGLSGTFPWLAQIASAYSQYRIHGMIFEFRPLITDYVTAGSPGVLVMSTNYNADDPPFTSKREMENSEFAVSVKPTEPIIHMIECDPVQTSITELYTRQGAVSTGQDLKTYDLGQFQLATQGNPAVLLGELWVTYCVEFFKPELPTVPVTSTSGSHITRQGVATTTYGWGPTSVSAAGGLSGVIIGNTLTYLNLSPSQEYYFTHEVTSDVVLSTDASYAVTTGTLQGSFATYPGAPNVYSSRLVRASGLWIGNQVIRSSSSGIIVVTITPGTMPVGNYGCDIYLIEMDDTLNN